MPLLLLQSNDKEQSIAVTQQFGGRCSQMYIYIDSEPPYPLISDYLKITTGL